MPTLSHRHGWIASATADSRPQGNGYGCSMGHHPARLPPTTYNRQSRHHPPDTRTPPRSDSEPIQGICCGYVCNLPSGHMESLQRATDGMRCGYHDPYKPTPSNRARMGSLSDSRPRRQRKKQIATKSAFCYCFCCYFVTLYCYANT